MFDLNDSAVQAVVEQKPQVVNLELVKNELSSLVDTSSARPEIVREASGLIEYIKNNDRETMSIKKIEDAGENAINLIQNKSKMLDKQIREFQANQGEGSPIAKELMMLQKHIADVDPTNVNFEKKGFLAKIFNPVKEYFEKLQTVNQEMDKITAHQEQGRKQLEQDNIYMENDIKELIRGIKVLKLNVETLTYVKNEITSYSEIQPVERKNFLEQEVLFTLTQKIIDMCTLENVATQASLSMSIIVRNNKELIRQAKRVQTITLFALKNALVVQAALSGQKAALEANKRISETTNNLLLSSAEKLKATSLEIHKEASTAVLDVQKLKQSFELVSTAFNEMDNYRQQALPQMNTIIGEFEDLSSRSRESLKNIEARVS
jgi:uncharacterized protein YaaN involved in tellurite resistance